MPETDPAEPDILEEPEEEATEEQRWEILRLVESWLELPMIVLGFVWLIIVIVELTRGLSPFVQNVSLAIWGVFVVDYAIRLWLAPRKPAYLKSTWLTALALLLPALRVFRVVKVVRALRAARAVRGVRFLQVVGSMNRGMRTLHRTMSRRGFGYVVLLTFVLMLMGAAGIFAFERPPGGGVRDYGTALWVTAMIMTTQGSDYWPQTAEGRLLFLLLAIYAVAVFGYLTATIASFFVARDAEEDRTHSPELRSMIALREEIAALRQQLQSGGERPPA
jgi:voltage-gated potassium channel